MKNILSVLVLSIGMVSCAPPSNKPSLSEQLNNIPYEMEDNYERQYQNMVKTRSDNGIICAHTSIAIVNAQQNGWSRETRKWGKRQIDLDCYYRSYKKHSDLPRG